MAGVILNTGDPILLEYGLTENMTLHLYTNNVDPATTNVIGDFTECTDADYSSITLTGGSWTVTTESNEGKATYAQQAFNLSASSPAVYGYYIAYGGAAVAAERFEDSGGNAAPTSAGTRVVYVGPVIRGNNRST